MESDDFPALYRGADKASIEAQSALLSYHRLNNFLLIAGASAAAWSTESKTMAILSAALFFASFFLYLYGKLNDLQAKWYRARALAESIKTATWRFVIAAEPFHEEDDDACFEDFRNLLNELLKDNVGIAASLSSESASGEQITACMHDLRKAGYIAKRDIYLKKRIDDQRDWYSRKSRENRASAKNWFVVLCVVYGIIILSLFVRIAEPGTPFLPIDVMAVAAGCIIGWIQVKRFDELASAYGLTAHEIGIIKSRFSKVSSAESLSRFVSDSENAFSREHTQWAARRDHAS